IRENPADDRARMVYADFLQDRGDPRGEFIALQLSKKEPKRAAQLLDKHGKRWLGAIGSAVADMRFERGVPVELVLNPRNEAYLEATIGAPEWWSVEVLGFRGMFAQSYSVVKLVCDPALRGVRELRGINFAPMRRLATTRAKLGVTTLQVASAISLSYE